MKLFYISLFLIFVNTSLFAQIEKERTMHRVISTPTGDELAPSLTPDGNTMIFMKKTTSSKEYHIHITTKSKGQWSRPVEIPILNKHSMMLMIGGYSISPDGNEIIYTTKKHPSIGGFDLWSSKKKNGNWSEPSNIGAPLNTKANEGMPSFSSDGNSLYFIRGHIHHHRLSGDVFLSKRNKSDQWSTPKKIVTPEKISQVQQTAGGTHLLLNDSKNIYYYNTNTKTSSTTILNDPYTFFSIYYKHELLIYSKEVDKMFDIYEAKITPSDKTAPPTLQYKIKTKSNVLLNLFDLNNASFYKQLLKPSETYTLYRTSSFSASIQNKALHFSTEKVTINTSKTKYSKLNKLLNPALLEDSIATNFSNLEVTLYEQYLKKNQTNTVEVIYSCPVISSHSDSLSIKESPINLCLNEIKKHPFFDKLQNTEIVFSESDQPSDKPRWFLRP